MVNRDRRNPIVLHKVRKQGINSGLSEHYGFWQEIIYDRLRENPPCLHLVVIREILV